MDTYLVQQRFAPSVDHGAPLLTVATAQLDRWVGPWFQARAPAAAARAPRRCPCATTAEELAKPGSLCAQRLAGDAAALREETDAVLARLRDLDSAAPLVSESAGGRPAAHWPAVAAGAVRDVLSDGALPSDALPSRPPPAYARGGRCAQL